MLVAETVDTELRLVQKTPALYVDFAGYPYVDMNKFAKMLAYHRFVGIESMFPGKPMLTIKDIFSANESIMGDILCTYSYMKRQHHICAGDFMVVDNNAAAVKIYDYTDHSNLMRLGQFQDFIRRMRIAIGTTGDTIHAFAKILSFDANDCLSLVEGKDLEGIHLVCAVQNSLEGHKKPYREGAHIDDYLTIDCMRFESYKQPWACQLSSPRRFFAQKPKDNCMK